MENLFKETLNKTSERLKKIGVCATEASEKVAELSALIKEFYGLPNKDLTKEETEYLEQVKHLEHCASQTNEEFIENLKKHADVK